MSSFSLVFYDVTTLYFESFSPDELRKNGFSKDHKSTQPQIVIGLVVSQEGFPIAYEIFAGNKFEGHTILPVVKDLKTKNQIETLTVVADAAMISMENIVQLQNNHLHYIVGARLGNLPLKTIQQISNMLKQQDQNTIRINTKQGNLICDFSQKRFKKDKYETEKQLQKAEALLQSSLGKKRIKFIKESKKAHYEINTALVEKTKLLLGIKGYYTNLKTEISNQTIIDHYHNLWHVEQAFRVAKNDLEMRPIFHVKEDAIKTHILICFMALVISKYMEIKTGKSLQSIIKTLKQITDAQMLNTVTKKKFTMRTKITPEVKVLLDSFGLSY